MKIVIVHSQDGSVNVAVEDHLGSAMESGTGRSTGPDGMEVAAGDLLSIVVTDHSGGEPDLDELHTEKGVA
jgi:hypothetical protein